MKLEAVVTFRVEADVSVLDSDCSWMGCTVVVGALFFFPKVLTMTGLAVTVRATIELLLFGSETPALASCAWVMAGTAGASGLRVCGDP
jgi:hypothetical protein